MQEDFTIPTLGTGKIPSPLRYSPEGRGSGFISDDVHIIYDVWYDPQRTENRNDLLEYAGPREKIYFLPRHVHAGILTCGGLCPGLNDVIRTITRSLWRNYGVRRISGIRFGYAGLIPENNIPTIDLNPDVVDDIHRIGGSILGSSRGGGERTEDIVDAIERLNLNMLFVIGGDGTQRGAMNITAEVLKRKLKISVIGIPKTIDNDLSYIEKSFGFETAVTEATKVVYSAHSEAHSAENGVGLVRLMGRNSGFIAAHTALASNDANFVLIPEVSFDLEGPNGLFTHLENRLRRRQHAVIIVAEGAGQHLLAPTDEKDKSGNPQLSDIGVFLKTAIKEYFKRIEMTMQLKYIDPSYLIRGAVAVPNDSLYCSRLAHNAVHAAMAGKTGVLISYLNGHFVHMPMATAVSKRNSVDPSGALWRDVIEATQQPLSMINTSAK